MTDTPPIAAPGGAVPRPGRSAHEPERTGALPGSGVEASPPRAARLAAAASAGTLAALLMLLAQLLWTTLAEIPGVQTLPDYIVAAISLLTPLGLFGFATEKFGSLAQNALFVAAMIGIVAVGSLAGRAAGWLAGRLSNSRTGAGFGARLGAGLLVAAALLLVVLVVVLPVANLGAFAADSGEPGQILLRLTTTFALFGVAWAAIAGALTEVGGSATGRGRDAAGRPIDRRGLLGQGAWGLGTLAVLLGVGGLGLRLMRPRARVDSVASDQAARSIASTAEARAAAGAGPAADLAPTSAAVPPQPGGQAAAPASAPTEAPAAAPVPAGGVDFAELQADAGLTPTLTSVADFYHVSKNISDPVVDGEGWSLTIDGLVDRPLTLDYEGLVGRATTRKITTLCCISNQIGGDLIGTAEWTGVPLAELLTEAGVRPEAVDLKLSCADNYEDSITVPRGLDPDTLVVVGMNGEPLTPDHGYPARLIVPGIYGMKNVKWVERIEAVDFDFQGYWQERGWSDPAPYQTWGRIDLPASGEKIAPGPAVTAGVASAGDRGIERVEVSLDEGENWANASLEPAINPPFTWVRWAYPFAAESGEYQMLVRITDGTGAVAPEREQPPLPDGATGWPSRKLRVEG